MLDKLEIVYGQLTVFIVLITVENVNNLSQLAQEMADILFLCMLFNNRC